jgi:hypothetical protein
MRVRWALAAAGLVAITSCGSTGLVQPDTTLPPPSPSASEAETNPPGPRCGVERWAVKTGTDPAAADVRLRPAVDTTVAKLTAILAPADPRTRVAPEEDTVYRVRATLTEYKREDDHDVHAVIVSAGQSMIVELPDPACAAGSAFLPQIRHARHQFDDHFGAATTRWRLTHTAVSVRGVGFFDEKHGQRGVARNGIELHPVLSITFPGA